MIAVVGSTGALGGEIVSRLRARGEQVRGLVRRTSDPARVEQLRAKGVGIVEGDLRDPASLRTLCHGARTVISTASIITTAKPGDSFADSDSAGTCALIDAAKAAGVAHFIFVSFDASQSELPDSPLVDAKRRVEAYLKQSGMIYTILQPSLFMEAWLGPHITVDLSAGTAKVLGDGDRQIGYVSVFDVAEVAAQSVFRPEARNATIRFGGPEAISQREAIRIMEEESGRPLQRIEIPEQAIAAQWSAAQDPFEKTFSALMLGVARGFGDQPPPPPGFTDRMTTVRDYARRAAANAP